MGGAQDTGLRRKIAVTSTCVKVFNKFIVLTYKSH